MKEKWLIIDGNNLLHSSYYVAEKLPWKMKQGTIFFFLRVMISILKKEIYHKLLVVFDGGGNNFRKSLLSQYKAQRKKMPQELLEQMQTLKTLLEETNIICLQIIDHEADDLIASFIKQQSNKPNLFFDILTRDKDLLQLIDNNVNILKHKDKKLTYYDLNQFQKEYNFSPQNYVDYLSLMGDNVDNISGVKGIGPVNARKLIQQFGTVENIYQNLEEIPDDIKKLLAGNEEVAFLNKKIISLDKEISLSNKEEWESVSFNWKEWKNNEKLKNFLLKNEFPSIVKLLT